MKGVVKIVKKIEKWLNCFYEYRVNSRKFLICNSIRLWQQGTRLSNNSFYTSRCKNIFKSLIWSDNFHSCTKTYTLCVIKYAIISNTTKVSPLSVKMMMTSLHFCWHHRFNSICAETRTFSCKVGWTSVEATRSFVAHIPTVRKRICMRVERKLRPLRGLCPCDLSRMLQY